MRFEALVFERYGAFTDRLLELRAGADLHVVLGANEAGKTSALNAIGDLLFGFPKTAGYDFLHEKTTLRVGARLRLRDGSTLSVRRRRGNKNTLLDADDKPLPDDLLASVLGSVGREAFFSEFGLTAEALRAGGEELQRAGGRLAETLSASSARLGSLARTAARLEREADELFSPSARTKPFNALYRQYEEAEKNARGAIVGAHDLAAAEAAAREAEARRAALNAEHDRVERESARRERALRTAPKLDRLNRLREELAGLRDLPEVDAETLALWREAREEDLLAEKQLADLRLEDAEGEREIAALTVDRRVLEIADQIGALREGLGAVRQAEGDLPGRQRDAFNARMSLDAAAGQLGIDGHEALLARQPSDLALTLARDLIDARRDAERRLAEAASAVATTQKELRELERENAKGGGACADPTPFSRRFEAFADVPADADRLRRETFARSFALRELDEEAARLDPGIPALDQLARLALPSMESIESARQEFLSLEEEEKSAALEMKAARESLAAAKENIRELSSAGAFATREQLGAARHDRDGSYMALDAALEGDPVERRKAFARLGAANRKLDATTDGLLDGAERAALYEAARARRAKDQRACEKLAESQDRRAARRAAAQAAWLELWAPIGLKPKTPRIMAEWRRNVEDVLRQRARLNQQGLELEALTEKIDARRLALTRLLADMGATEPGATEPVEVIYNQARLALDALQSGWTRTHAQIVLADKVAEELIRAKKSHAHVVEEIEALREPWAAALAAIGLAEEMTPGQAEAALGIWKDVPLHRQKLAYENERIGKMQARIAEFEAEVAKLVAHAAPELAERAPREALDELSRRLFASRGAHEQRESLANAARKRASVAEKHARKRIFAHARLAAARQTLGLDESAPLAESFERLKRRSSLLLELADALRDLRESGDGRDEEALRLERGDMELDLLPGEVERLKIVKKQIFDDVAVAAAAAHEARCAREALAAGRDAASAAQAKAEAGAALLEVATRWLARASAAKLAARAMERHRVAVRDPLLSRASALFAVATDGAYTGLGADYDDADTPTLVGIHASGARKRVDHMSEGARDQLFLALRLALLELRAAEPLPFIGDDLLASFDETRTATALGLLAEFGRARQAIIFTHHQHVARIASELPGANVDVIAL